jgi:hypothetical protein
MMTDVLSKDGMTFSVAQKGDGWVLGVKAKGITVASLSLDDSEMLKVCAAFEQVGQTLLTQKARSFMFICTGPCDYHNQMTGLGEPKELHAPTQCPKCGQMALRAKVL